MRKRTSSGFTLIELLVVITIIGILSTSAVSVYTSQIQKARDSTRITSISAIRSWVEQFYQDKWAYPEPSEFLQIKTYTPNLPKDPKTWQASSTTSFDYAYVVWPDSSSIIAQDFEISTWLENSGNISDKAARDGGWAWAVELARLEIWIDIVTNPTPISGVRTANASWVGATTIPPTACGNISWAVWGAKCTASSGSATSNILIIR